MTQRRVKRWRVVVIACALIAGFVAVSLFDGQVFRSVGATMDSRARLDGAWWYQVLRQSGSLLPWLLVGVAVLALDRVRRGRGTDTSRPLRGPYIAVSAGAAGLAAELLKLVIGRERPAVIEMVDGVEQLVYQGYHFRGLFSGFADGSNLGLPSSHAAVAAGGAFALARVWPKAWPLAVVIAVGCGTSRVLTGAHFASDVYGGIVVGWLVSVLFSPDWGANRGGKSG